MGLITIKNSQTGEVKQVDSSQLGNYGINQNAPTNSNRTKTVEEVRQSNTLPKLIGGVGGGLLGTLAGGPVGGVVGAAGGGAIGSALNDFAASIFSLLKGQPVHQPNPLDYFKSGAEQGGYQALGEGIGGVAKFAAHPIGSVVNNMVVKPLAESPATVDIAQILGDLFQQGKSQFAKKLISTQFPEAYNTLSTNVASSLTDLLPHQAAQNIAPGVAQGMGDIASQIIPVSDANILKTSAQRGVGDFYGEQGPAMIELQKLLASLLKNKIESTPGVPASVGIGNKIASLMYGVPDALSGLSYGLPWQTGRVLRNASSVPIHLAQFLLDNPVSQASLPALTQLLGGMGGNP